MSAAPSLALAPSADPVVPAPTTTTVSVPLVILTVVDGLPVNDKSMNYRALGVAQALKAFFPNATLLLAIGSIDLQSIDASRTLVLFDSFSRKGRNKWKGRRGLYTFRGANRFPSVHGLSPWAVAGRWSIAIHQDEPQRIAQQLAKAPQLPIHDKGLVTVTRQTHLVPTKPYTYD